MTPEDRATLQRYIKDRCTISDDGCWNWNLSIGNHGYGQASKPALFGGRVSLAHRMSFAAFNHEPDPKKQIDHLCKNKVCVNPDHLEEVSQRLNVRRQFGGCEDVGLCRRGHKNWMTNSAGYLECRDCQRIPNRLTA